MLANGCLRASSRSSLLGYASCARHTTIFASEAEGMRLARGTPHNRTAHLRVDRVDLRRRGTGFLHQHRDAAMAWNWKYGSAIALFGKLPCLGNRLMYQDHDGDRSVGCLHHQVRDYLAAKAAAIGITNRRCVKVERHVGALQHWGKFPS